MAVRFIVLLLTLTDAATALFQRQHKHKALNLNWTDAQAFCTENFSYVGLSVIDSQSEFNNLKRQTGSKNGWIGLERRLNETDFTQWIDGENLTFTMWNIYEPKLDKHCAHLNTDKWETSLCTDLKNFFCYTWKPKMIVVQEMKTWEEALVHCRQHYTDLVSLVSVTDDILVNNRIAEIQTPAFWTSLRFMDGSWFWVNERSVANVTALPSCPAMPLRCGARNHQSNVWWNRDCQEKMNFICYDKVRKNF